MTAVGIDLGTTFSCVAYYNKGKAEIIPDKSGHRLIPSFVYYDPDSGEVYVGKIAYGLATQCPTNGLKDIKRLIGRKYDDEFLKEYRLSNQTQFSIVKGDNDLAAFEITIGKERVIKTPVEVSSEILKYLKNSASAFLNQNVREAVISIPAYFSNAQRKATKKAAELAGLNVLKLISEPTAGAIHYTKDKNINAKMLVFDWGGGTLDVSLIEVRNKTFEVKSVYGDTLLGGRNIDKILFDHFYTPVSRQPERFARRLHKECINLKEDLSVRNNVTKIMEFYDGDKDLTLSMTRREFEDLAEPIFEQVMNIVRIGLFNANWDKSIVDDVILVGGSTRIPKVSEMLQSFFGSKTLKTDLNPDEAVACGACIQAALLKYNNHIVEKYVIREVTPLSLGVELKWGLFKTLISKNSCLPVKQKQSFMTLINNQTEISIKIFEGVRKNCVSNNKLGEFCIKNLPRRRAGDVKIWVEFNLDEDGILTVTAYEENNRSNSNSLTITMEEFRLSDKKIKLSLEDAIKHKQDDDIFEKFILRKTTLTERCQYILYEIKTLLSNSDKVFVEQKCNDFMDDIEEIKFTEINKLTSIFIVLMESISPVLKRYTFSNLNFSAWGTQSDILLLQIVEA